MHACPFPIREQAPCSIRQVLLRYLSFDFHWPLNRLNDGPSDGIPLLFGHLVQVKKVLVLLGCQHRQALILNIEHKVKSYPSPDLMHDTLFQSAILLPGVN